MMLLGASFDDFARANARYSVIMVSYAYALTQRRYFLMPQPSWGDIGMMRSRTSFSRLAAIDPASTGEYHLMAISFDLKTIIGRRLPLPTGIARATDAQAR